MKNSTLPSFQLGPGFWACIPQQFHSSLLRRYTGRAKELLSDCQACPPDDDRLQLIVAAALEARLLLFASAFWDPSAEDLDAFFDQFVLWSVSGSPASSEVTHEN